MSEKVFTLEIRLGNDEMQTARDVAAALMDVVAKLDNDEWHPGHTKSILDANGNRVGGWKMPAGSEVPR